jgi:hypothetical protein
MTAIAHQPHPVTRALAGVRDQLRQVAGIPVWSMDAAETTSVLDEIQSGKAQLAELEARVLAHAERIDLAGNTGATSTANWHAVATRTTRVQAHRAMRLADRLETHDLTRAALAEGRIHVEQAEAILRALAELPDNLDPDITGKAEQHLLALAADHDAKALKHLGRHILEVASPDAADAHEAALLEKEEREAQAATRLTMWDDGHGKVHGRFTLPTFEGAALKKALLAIAAPKHQASKGPLGERVPTPQRLGLAFCEYIARFPAKRLPQAGGLNATVVVLMPLDTLMGGLKAAHLDTGEPISPGQARRLAADAAIIPAVLGSKSQVLDLGRKNRFGSEAQRILKTIEQGGCEAEGCDAPPGTCHLHHNRRWADGGQTNSDDLIMICPWHHSRAHDQHYDMTALPTGKYTFHRRT